jgi:hypothetical protein
MKRKDYYTLMNTWNLFLIKESEEPLNIDSQIQRAVKKILEFKDQQLKILITKDRNEFVLKADLVDSNNKELIDEVAYITFRKFSHYYVEDQEGLGRNCYMLDFTEFVKYNLGPLMYDIIMEIASRDQSFLCCDRFEVSGEAQNLWKNYFSRRGNDVKHVQLDIENDSLDPKEFPNLTPQIEDDFYQNISIKDKGKSWPESPFSKGYYKLNNNVTDFIKNSELFIYKELTH